MENHLKKLVEVRLKLLGKTPTKAATDVGLGRTFINDILVGRKQSIRPDAIERLATTLQLAPEEIALAQRGVWLKRWGETVNTVDLDGIVPAEYLPKYPEPNVVDRQSIADVPLIGLAMGSVIQNKITGLKMSDAPIDYVRRPPALANSKGIYAILVAGDSMSPMHPPGELRFVNPHRPVESGDTVIVRTRLWEGDPGQAYIKVLQRQTPDRVVLEQLNPAATIEIPRSVVESIHRVLTTRELFGL